MHRKSTFSQVLSFLVSLSMVMALAIPDPAVAWAAAGETGMAVESDGQSVAAPEDAAGSAAVAEEVPADAPAPVDGEEASDGGDVVADEQEGDPAEGDPIADEQQPADGQASDGQEPVADEQQPADEQPAEEQQPAAEQPAEEQPSEAETAEKAAAEEETALEAAADTATTDEWTSIKSMEDLRKALDDLTPDSTVNLRLDANISWNAADYAECPFTVTMGTVALNLNNHKLQVQADQAVQGGSVIHVDPGAKLTITDGWLGYGTISGGWNSFAGGGIVNGGELTIVGGTIENCRSEVGGGGIYNEGTLKATNLYVENNQAQVRGGGIWNLDGTISFEGGLIGGNQVLQTTDGNIDKQLGIGGGICNNAELVIRDVPIRSNRAMYGAGISSVDWQRDKSYNIPVKRFGDRVTTLEATALISHCTITKNAASRCGGGVYAGYAKYSSDDRTLATTIEKSTTITNNTAGEGGGVYVQSYGVLRLDTATITKNRANTGQALGGGIFLQGEMEGALQVAGKPVVRDNTSDVTGAGNVNLYKTNTRPIQVVGALESGALIHLTRNAEDSRLYVELTHGYSDAMGDADPASVFVADDKAHVVFLKNGEVRLAKVIDYIDYVDGVRTPSTVYDYTQVEAGDNGNWKGAMDDNTVRGGWYVCVGDVTMANRAFCKFGENVRIILCDGCHLKLEKGMGCCCDENDWGGNKQVLSIYGQEGMSGLLEAYGPDTCAAIGSRTSYPYGCGDVNIYGGTVKAYGGAESPGIGHGSNEASNERVRPCGVYTQWDGDVTCIGAYRSKFSGTAGLGGGSRFPNMTVIVNGGKLYARGGANGPGIGSGNTRYYSDSGDMLCDTIINGGYVEVVGGENYEYPGIGTPRIYGSADIVFRGGHTKVSSPNSSAMATTKGLSSSVWFCGGTVELITSSKLPQLDWDYVYLSKDPENGSYNTGYRVLQGSSSGNAQAVEASKRVDAYKNVNKDHSYVRIEECTDHAWVFDEASGTATCTWCGRQSAFHTVTFEPGVGSGDPVTKYVCDGESLALLTAEEVHFTLPAVDLRSLASWKAEGSDDVYHLGEEVPITQDTTFVAQWTLTWAELQEHIKAASNRATLILPCDVVATDTDTALVIPAGKTLALNLNGYTLDRNLGGASEAPTAGVSPGSVLEVDGKLIVTDRKGTGTIEGGFAQTGGGVYVLGGGSVDFRNGSIENNRAQTGGGVYVDEGGSFAFDGRSIASNSALEGGGVYVAKGGSFHMTSNLAQITDNRGQEQGGGVLVEGSCTVDNGTIGQNAAARGGGIMVRGGTLDLAGGNVSSNTANVAGGAIFVDADATFNLSGLPTIEKNESDTGASNVYLQQDARITVPDTLDPYGSIGVAVENPPAAGRTVELTDGLEGRGSYERFTSENEGFAVGCNLWGEAVLGALATVSFDLGAGDGEMDPETVVTGSSYTLPEADVTPPRGLVFLGWKIPGDTRVWEAGLSLTVEGDTTLTAQYGQNYNVWVDNVQVTASNCDDVLGDGTVTFAPKTNTLHLDNPTLTKTCRGANIYAKDLDLTVTGTAALNHGDNYGIYVDGAVTLGGDLSIRAGVRGVYAEAITIADGTVAVTVNNSDGYGLAIKTASTGGIVVADEVERLEVQAGHPFYAQNDSIVIGDRLRIEEPGGGEVVTSPRGDGLVTARIFDADGVEPDRVLITPNRVEGSKQWVCDSDALLPQRITVRLHADGTVVDAQTVTAADGWSWSFVVPRCQDGREIAYTLTEDAVPDFVSQVDGLDVTNSYKPGMTQVSVTAAWDDADDADGLRPDAVTVHLLADGEDTGKTLTLSADNTWTGSFGELAARKNGTQIAYTVRADRVAQYETTVAGDATRGFALTHTHAPATIDIATQVVWDDGDNRDGKRPSDVVVHLLAEGEEVASAVLSADEDWSHRFAQMQKNRGGAPVAYTVVENSVASYAREVTGSASEGFVVTNTHTPQTREVNALVEWIDGEDQDGRRPESATLALTGTVTDADGKTTVVSVDAQSTRNDRVQWVVPAYHQGLPVSYTVAETDAQGASTVPEGYTASVEGFRVTNEHTPEKVAVAGTLTWDDDGNRDGMRPAQVSVQLLANGTELTSKVVEPAADAGDTWTCDFGAQDRYAAGEEIVYSMVVKEVKQYRFAADGMSAVGTHESARIDVPVSVWWADEGDRDALRPTTVTLHLLAGTTELASVTLERGEDGWGTVFEDVYQYQDGKEIAYTITEDAFAYYTYEVEGSAAEGFDVTNTHEVEKVDVTGTITWDDDNDRDGMRPDYVIVNLLYHGSVMESRLVAPKDGVWTYRFYNQPKYEHGQLAVQTFSVEHVRGYTFAQVQGSNDFVATHGTVKVDVQGSLAWDDADDQDGLRPESVTVTLTGTVPSFDDSGGVHVVYSDTQTSSNGRWAWTDVPRYAEGWTIAYTVAQTDAEGASTVPAGYEATVDGFNITNTHTPEVRDVPVSVTWDDADDQDGLRPEELDVHLLADGTEVASALVTATDGWKTSFADLPTHAGGKAIAYTLSVDAPQGYTATAAQDATQGFVVTAARTPEVRPLTGTASWDDDDDRDGKRPESVVVHLLADDVEVASQTVKADAAGAWTWSFADQPVYAAGAEIVYSVALDSVEGYGCEVEGCDATLTHEPARVSRTVVVSWDDNDNQDRVRPAQLVINLMAGDTSYGSVTLNAATDWTATIDNLYQYADGKELAYVWEQWAVPPKYQQGPSTVSGSITTLVNIHEPATTETSFQLHWVDGNNSERLRPASVIVVLMRSGSECGTYYVNEETGWSVSAQNLPAYGAYKKYRYTWAVQYGNWIDDYRLSLIERSDTHAEYTYTLTGTTSFTVSKEWRDGNNQDQMRPTSLEVELLRNNQRTFNTVELSEENGWSYTWDNLPRFDGDQGEIAYSAAERAVPGYYLEETKATEDGVRFTNARSVNVRHVSASASWLDGRDAAGTRPESLEVALHAEANGRELSLDDATRTLDASNGWSCTWSGLLDTMGGMPITYTLSEVSVEGYRSTTTGTADEGFAITNTLLGSAQVTKVWDDDGDRDGVRPESLRVQLLANDVPHGDAVTLSEATGWTATVADLARYNASGAKIAYTWKELDAPQDYELTSSTTKDLATTLTNTHEPARTKATVSATWVDGEDQDGLRPHAVEVQLLGADDKVVGTASLSAANDWEVTVSDLPRYDQGKEVTYSWVPSFAGMGTAYTVETQMEDTQTSFTYTHIPATVDLRVTKKWYDGDDWLGLRPETLELELLANGERTGQTVTLDASNRWTAVVSGQPAFEAGEPIAYSWTETLLPIGYALTSTKVDASGYATTLNNELRLIVVTIVIVWDDADDADGMRPDHVGATLSNGLASGATNGATTTTLTEEDDWKATVSNLPLADGMGGELVYEWIMHEIPEGYELVRTHVAGGTTTFTLRHVPEQTSVAVSQVWDDDDNRDGLRAQRVKVSLLADGVDTGKRLTLSADNSWKDVFANLPRRDNGNEIAYTVRADAVTGYHRTTEGNAEKGFVLTSSHTPATAHISVSKSWDDANNQDGLRPAQVKVHLLADKAEVASAVLSEANEWKASFTGLPKYQGGKEITYTVAEDQVAGYTPITMGSATEGFAITNVHTAETVVLAGTLNWDDAADQDGMRPTKVQLRLLVGGNEVDELVVKPGNDGSWAWSFGELPRYAKGAELAYELAVDEVEGYTFATSGSDVTGTHEPATVDVNVAKRWDDADDQDGRRPERVTVHLLADGTEVESATLSTVDGWMATFEDLPVYAQGARIAYTLSEDAVVGYATVVTGDAAQGFTVTNRHVPLTEDIMGSLSWEDADNQDGLRPEAVTVTLTGTVTAAEGERVEVYSDTLTTRNGRWLWEDMPAYHKGRRIDYVLAQADASGVSTVPEGYVSTVSGFNITNTCVPETLDVDVTKVWDDADDQDGVRPERVVVRLLADGAEVASATLDELGGWKATFEKVPMRAAGKLIAYTLTEDAVAGYTAAVAGSVAKGFDVTNTHKPETREVEGTLTWDDANDQDGLRPDSVTVTLAGSVIDDGAQVVEVFSDTLTTHDDGWQWVVPAYHAGEPISYVVAQADAEGASTVPEGYAATAKGLNITDTHTPETMSVSVTAVWADGKDAEGKRPSIEAFAAALTLLADGKEVSGTAPTVVDVGDGTYTATWSDLPKNTGGNAIVYTVREGAFDGYATATDTVADGGTLTNTLSATVEVTGSQTWTDGGLSHDNAAEVTLVLTRTSEREGATAETVAATPVWDGDQYRFEDLPAYDAAGYAYTYAVAMEPIEGYRITQTDNSFACLRAGQMSVTVRKVWDDEDDHDGLRPARVAVQLLANGEAAGAQVTLSATDAWAHTWAELAQYDEEGIEIAYTVEEPEVPEGYVATVSGDATKGFTLTNTHAVKSKPKTSTITYRLNGGRYNGSGADIVERHQDGAVIKVHAAPVRTGYTFSYWKGSSYQPGDSYTVAGDHTFVAQWKKNAGAADDQGGGSSKPVSSGALVATGDDALPVPYVVGMALAGVVLAALGVFLRRRL